MQEILPPRFGTLGEILMTARSHPHGYALYLPSDEVWTLSSRCALMDPNDVESDDEDDPLIARNEGLTYALGGGDIKGIYDNLSQQVVEVRPALLLEAFLFYYDNDAFFEVSGA